ncbi:YlbL family protein [Compostimonas suwonensis]|uniref:endopeptidase La n=1 Tax=Compostimonas suwonensis TaxID=1048394 RepID=A0A2M9BWF8_9MICO|nr:PDZ domain-containing protein [Compostimonas suwonensis]PJJ62288.1 PDZ domain-containing protein [Compostimonas suwonensis]
MALFSDDSNVDPYLRHGRRPSRGWIGWLILFIAIGIGILLAMTPSPYVIEQPGPVYNTLGTAPHEGEEVPLISIDGEETFPTAGSLDMLTVSVVGNPSSLPNWLDVALAWGDSKKAVVPVESVYPAGTTSEERDAENATLMVDSQQDAVAAALSNLGYDFPEKVTVVDTIDDTPASGVLESGDIITTVDGQAIADVDALRASLADSGAGVAIELGIERAGEQQTVTITPAEIDGSVAIGINVTMSYDFPFDVSIQLDNVGGPSAGMMFALGIIDKLTPGELNGGQNVAGTGTIDAAGEVGAIGGIRQKLYGARDAGATWFLAPASNCDEVAGHIPSGLTVFSVETLDDSLTALEAISTGADTSKLPTCSTPAA